METISNDTLKYEILSRLDQHTLINYSIYDPSFHQYCMSLLYNDNQKYDIENAVINDMSSYIFKLVHRSNDNIGDIIYYSIKHNKLEFIREYINLYDSPDMESCFIDWFNIIFNKYNIDNADIRTFEYLLYHLYKFHSIGLCRDTIDKFIDRIIGTPNDSQSLNIILRHIPISENIFYYVLYTYNIEIIRLCLGFYIKQHGTTHPLSVNIITACFYNIKEKDIHIIEKLLELFEDWDYMTIYSRIIHNKNIDNENIKLEVLKNILLCKRNWNYTNILFSIYTIPGCIIKWNLIEYIIYHFGHNVNWNDFNNMLNDMKFMVKSEDKKLKDTISKLKINKGKDMIKW
ncbi:Hypothetical protein ORPV_513 [Orpheovirus IHUMI-LCC2]|uniref:Uncharacterized protein n=1 Tax=Orpheovirus IHUMI-LCC2 TaxID=2023057 RepID=A0A2I2L4G3_9VIRU|nr:Hypothetical protein ORPV_513 [Orpheovirus IHUMI-LCC2]SNW62417.1 Hypothetical protein ORPV_513 [Orpheovirus IHUMI-LCC2]